MSETAASGLRPCVDWRNAEDYRHLLDYDRAGWAGEWLRRNPAFVADVHRAPHYSEAFRFGSDRDVAVIDGGKDASLARWGLHGYCAGNEPLFFWRSEVNAQVLTLEAKKATNQAEAFDLRKCSLFKAAFRDVDQETHLLFGDGVRTLQVVVKGDVSFESPMNFRCALSGWSEFETKPLSLRRLCCLYRLGRLSSSLYPKEQRAHRWVEMIRAWDGVQAGAKQRDIAIAIYGDRAAHEDWDSGYRARVQRLIRSSERMVGGGYLDLLRSGSGDAAHKGAL